MKTFLHSGDMGDIVYCLPVIRQMGGGKLYLDVTGGAWDPDVAFQMAPIHHWRLKFNRQKFEFLRSLLDTCSSYLEFAEWNGEQVDVNFNQIRRPELCGLHGVESIVKISSRVAGWELSGVEPWLEVPKNAVPEQKFNRKKVVCARSLRSNPNFVFWMMISQFLSSHCAMVGTKLEWSALEEVIGMKLLWKETRTALELAVEINSADWFVGNMSLPLAIAEGLGKNRVVETTQFTKVPMITSGKCLCV